MYVGSIQSFSALNNRFLTKSNQGWNDFVKTFNALEKI